MLCTAYLKTLIKNIGHRCVKKDISILMQKMTFLDQREIIWSFFNDINILKLIWGQT